MNKKTAVVCLAVVAMAAAGAWADMYVPPPRAMSHAEWLMASGVDSGCSLLLMLAVPCSAVAAFLFVLVASVRRRRPSWLVCLACCVPAVFFHPMTYESPLFEVLFFTIAGFAAAAWAVAVVLSFLERRFAKAVFYLLATPVVFFAHFMLTAFVDFSSPTCFVEAGERSHPVAAMPGETYEEYLKRANRTIYNLCPKCDARMQSGYAWGRYWYCDRCGHGKKAYEEALRRCRE